MKYKCLTSIGSILPILLIATALLAACIQAPDSPGAPVDSQVKAAGSPAAPPAAAATDTPAPSETPAETAPVQAETPARSTTVPTGTPLEGPTPTGVPEGGEVIQPDNALQVQAVSGVRLPETRLFAWLPDSQGVAVASETHMIFYSLNPLKETRRFSASAVTNLEISADGALLAWAGEDNTIHLWSFTSAQELRTLSGRSTGLNSLEFSPDGKILAVSTSENTVELWDTATAQLIQTWKLGYWVTGLDLSPDGLLLAGVELDNFTVHIFQMPAGQEQRALSWTEHASPALYGARFTPDWQTLVWWSRGTVQIMAASSGNLGPSLGHEDFVSAVALSPESRLLASAAAGTVGEEFLPVVYLWDINTGEQINQLPQEEAVTALDFSPDGRTLAILTFDNILRFWEVPETPQ